jgi:hypothetical protein
MRMNSLNESASAKPSCRALAVARARIKEIRGASFLPLSLPDRIVMLFQSFERV